MSGSVSTEGRDSTQLRRLLDAECSVVSSDNQRMPAESERAHERSSRMTLRRFSSAVDADRHDLEFWQELSAADRILLVWRLSQEQWQLAGTPTNEPGLCRSVASVRRR